MVSKLDYVPNLPWDIPGWIWDMITFGTSIYPKSEVRFGMYEIRIPVWDIPKLIWDISSVWATTEILRRKSPTDLHNSGQNYRIIIWSDWSVNFEKYRSEERRVGKE